jgi:transcriptional regulator with XRE-family HTH domain
MVKDDFLNKLGRRIVQLREQKEIRQVDLAFKIDMDDGSLRRIESGKTNPTINTLRKIASGLDIEIKDLLDF